MIKTTINLTVGAVLALIGTQAAYARGFGGAHPSNYHAPDNTTAAHGAAGTAVKGPSGNVYTHPSSSTSANHGTESYHAPDNTTVAHGADGTAVKGSDGNVYAHPASSTGTYHATAGYSAAHVALPTDAGYGMPAAATGGAAYANNHQTQAVNASAYAAHGTAVRTSFNGSGMYGQSWYGAHPGSWSPAGWAGGQAWSAATWPTVGASLGWGASVQPMAYNYGDNITYQGDQVYYGSQPVATADQYYQQASALAQSAPTPDPNSEGWTPLGVFALVQGEQSDPRYIVQLAVNKSGALAGNYSDLTGGTNVLIQGAVDKKTQRVAWTVGSNRNTVGETGIYNLTKDEAPVLIHIGKDKTQQWMLVRLKQSGPGESQK